MSDSLTIPSEDDMSFEAAEWNTLRHGSQLTLDEKLDWLEDMLELMREFQSARQSSRTINQNDNSE
jgi:hypothetical protein